MLLLLFCISLRDQLKLLLVNLLKFGSMALHKGDHGFLNTLGTHVLGAHMGIPRSCSNDLLVKKRAGRVLGHLCRIPGHDRSSIVTNGEGVVYRLLRRPCRRTIFDCQDISILKVLKILIVSVVKLLSNSRPASGWFGVSSGELDEA